MKRKLARIKPYAGWLILLLSMDCFAGLLLWLSDAAAFRSMLIVIILTSLLFFSIVIGILILKSIEREQAFYDFLKMQDLYHENKLLKKCSPIEQQAIHQLSSMLNEKAIQYQQINQQINDYEEYVEKWAHETKTPLSLLTMILDNHRDEIPATVAERLDYVRNSLQTDITQMLFYARLKSANKDYLFQTIDLRECIEDILLDYQPLIDEKHIKVTLQIEETQVYSDKRGLSFLISQLMSNAIKYSDCQKMSKIDISCMRHEGYVCLCVADNGIGIRPCDLPYIFDRGFTGDSVDGRRKATGMGLYLAKMIADDMKLALSAESEWKIGSRIYIVFPVIKEETEGSR